MRIKGILEPTSLQSEDYFNKSRHKIGLETMDELRKKVLFRERDKRFQFNNVRGIFTIIGEFKKQK